MAKRSEAWKNLERAVAMDARKAGFSRAFRVLRGDDIGISAVDVILPEVPHVKLDTKYSGKGWRHHTLFLECEKKYCTRPEDIMILPTKGGRERGSLATIRTEVLMELLSHKYLAGGRDVGTLGCPQCNAVALPKKIGLDLSECTCTSCGLVYFMRSSDIPPGAETWTPKKAINLEEHPLEIEANELEETARVPQKRKPRAKKGFEEINLEIR